MNRLLADEGIVRNRRKVQATIHNARMVQELIAEHGSFRAYLRTLDELDHEGRCKELSGRFRNLGLVSASIFLRSVNEADCAQ